MLDVLLRVLLYEVSFEDIACEDFFFLRISVLAGIVLRTHTAYENPPAERCAEFELVRD